MDQAFRQGWGERRGANGDGGSGGEGWREWAGGVSEKSLPIAQRLERAVPSLPGRRWSAEFAVRLPVPATVVVERMADAGFLAGIGLGEEFVDGDDGLLISVTERRTRDEIDAYVTALAKAVA